MTVAEVALYLFSVMVVLAAFAVVFSRSSVHAVLFLILAFFNASGLFLLLGAEFLAMVLVIIYVGAVATLFLFVVMMLDVERIQKHEGLSNALPLGVLVGLVLLAELLFIGSSWGEISVTMVESGNMGDLPIAAGVDNATAIGRFLYTDYFLPFQLAGVILLIAMVGSIVLTLTPGIIVKRQNISKQNARKPEDSVELHSVTPGEGV